MNPNLDRPTPRRRDFDDEQLGSLVRSIADEWRMPPQRLDQPTWREWTRHRTEERGVSAMRLVGPAAAALVATVVLAVAAVWLNAPRGDFGAVGQSPGVSGSRGPESTSLSGSTPLPRLLRNGALPTVTQVMVRSEGRYRLASLATGTLGPDALGAYNGPTALVPRPQGGWLCICSKTTAFAATGGASSVSLTLATIDAAGANVLGKVDVRTVEGTRDPDLPVDLQFNLVDSRISVVPDGKTAFFAWAARNGGAAWTSGIDVIDIALGTVVSSTNLVVEPRTTAQGWPTSHNAPSVDVSPTGDLVLLSAYWFGEDPNTSDPGYGLDRWTVPFDGRTIGEPTRLELETAGDCDEFDGGLVDSAAYYQVCSRQSGDLAVRRFRLSGAPIGETSVPRTGSEFSAGSLVARSGDGLYLWDPVAAVMSRVDLTSGGLTVSHLSARSGGPLDALGTIGRRIGRWVAPSALAKILLEPGIVVSPDGTRVYAIGITSSAPGGRGSTGIFAFDAASLTQVGHWQPTADFTSIAISGDGRFVYAAAQGGVDAAGVGSRNGASVTVFDASDGSVRLIAGELGSADLWFANPTLD